MRSKTFTCVVATLVLSLGGIEAQSDPSLDARPAADRQSDETIRVGAVAYSPGTVTVFDGIRRYFRRHGESLDYVLYSNYDALVDALAAGHVDVAWNTPLAHAKFHARCDGESQTLVMRDVDVDFRSTLVARGDSGIESLGDLAGKTLVLGSNQAAEATVLPMHYLTKQGVDLEKVEVLSLDGKVDLEGNPCSSERHVMAALLDGRAEAGIIGQRLWKSYLAKHASTSELAEVWTSPAFSHCVFSAGKDFDSERAERFRELMLAMEPDDALTKQIMRLEGTRRWVPGTQEGFIDLFEAIDKN